VEEAGTDQPPQGSPAGSTDGRIAVLDQIMDKGEAERAFDVAIAMILGDEVLQGDIVEQSQKSDLVPTIGVTLLPKPSVAMLRSCGTDVQRTVGFSTGGLAVL
jgi:hypothetical protein